MVPVDGPARAPAYAAETMQVHGRGMALRRPLHGLVGIGHTADILGKQLEHAFPGQARVFPRIDAGETLLERGMGQRLPMRDAVGWSQEDGIQRALPFHEAPPSH